MFFFWLACHKLFSFNLFAIIIRLADLNWSIRFVILDSVNLDNSSIFSVGPGNVEFPLTIHKLEETALWVQLGSFQILWTSLFILRTIELALTFVFLMWRIFIFIFGSISLWILLFILFGFWMSFPRIVFILFYIVQFVIVQLTRVTDLILWKRFINMMSIFVLLRRLFVFLLLSFFVLLTVNKPFNLLVEIFEETLGWNILAIVICLFLWKLIESSW